MQMRDGGMLKRTPAGSVLLRKSYYTGGIGMLTLDSVLGRTNLYALGCPHPCRTPVDTCRGVT
jgi:hypothetical protein